MNSKKIWIIAIIVIALVGSGYVFRSDLQSWLTGSSAVAGAQPLAASETTTIRAADDSSQVSAAGNIALVSETSLIFQVEGTITAVNVDVGDEVAAGDQLAAVDTTTLERAVAEAELDLESAQLQLDSLYEEADTAEVASAQASLLAHQKSFGT